MNNKESAIKVSSTGDDSCQTWRGMLARVSDCYSKNQKAGWTEEASAQCRKLFVDYVMAYNYCEKQNPGITPIYPLKPSGNRASGKLPKEYESQHPYTGYEK